MPYFNGVFFLSNINTHELTPSARYTDFLCGDDWRIVVVGYGVAAVFAALGIDEMNTIIGKGNVIFVVCYQRSAKVQGRN